MGFQVSPGVEVKEVDLTNVIPAVSTSIGAFAGHFSWGPVGETMTVSSEKELAEAYGVPTGTATGGEYDNFVPFLQAASFLKYGNALVVSRAIDAAARNAVGSAHGESTDVHSTYIGNKETFDAIAFTTSDGNSPGEAINAAVIHARCPGKLGNSLKVSIAHSLTNSGDFTDSALSSVVSTSASTTSWASTNIDGSANDEIHIAIIDEDGQISGTKGTVLEIFEGLSLYSDAVKDGGTNYYKTVINRDSEYIFIDETAFKEYFRASVDNVDYALPGEVGLLTEKTFGALAAASRITTGTDSQDTPVLGAIDVTVNITGANSLQDGTYTIVDDVDTNGILNSPSTNNGSGAKFAITIAGGGDSPSENEISVNVLNGGFQYAVDDEIVISGTLLGGDATDNIVLKVKSVDNAIPFDFSLVNGTDGGSTAQDEGHVVSALGEFDNPENIDINLLFAEQFDDSTLVGQEIIRIAGTARKDCIGFISADRSSDSAADVTTDHANYNSSYVVCDSSAVYVYNKYRDDFVYINASGHMAGLCARTDQTNDAWFSPAGYNRGNLLGVTKLKWNPNKTDRDTLYKAGINPIIAQPGQGILLFGDKTKQSKPSAFDRINVRRLFVVIEKAIATASKFQLFELNDEFTRAMFRNMVEPFLRDVQGRRGINDFLVVCDETNNTGDIIDTNRFVADIYIKPARSINFITLNFVATRTGIEFSEIVGTGN
jgi:phage tail sheath protein FI